MRRLGRRLRFKASLSTSAPAKKVRMTPAMAAKNTSQSLSAARIPRPFPMKIPRSSSMIATETPNRSETNCAVTAITRSMAMVT